MTILHLDVEPFTKYSSVTLHLSPATRIVNENHAIIIIIPGKKRTMQKSALLGLGRACNYP